MRFGYALVVLTLIVSPAVAGPLEDVVQWCTNNTGAPTNVAHMAIKMPDGNPRGLRPPSTLAAEARGAKAAGHCDTALEWMVHCVEHDEGAKNVLRADQGKTCGAL
ncbi:hypothetical protein BH10PSE9_BH10PSE9_16310 [soil metagenome]